MRIARIELEGPTGSRAVLHRSAESPVINAELMAPAGAEHIEVPGDDKDQLWALATRIQRALDGRAGGNGDIRSYFLPIELMSDL